MKLFCLQCGYWSDGMFYCDEYWSAAVEGGTHGGYTGNRLQHEARQVTLLHHALFIFLNLSLSHTVLDDPCLTAEAQP